MAIQNHRSRLKHTPRPTVSKALSAKSGNAPVASAGSPLASPERRSDYPSKMGPEDRSVWVDTATGSHHSWMHPRPSNTMLHPPKLVRAMAVHRYWAADCSSRSHMSTMGNGRTTTSMRCSQMAKDPLMEDFARACSLQRPHGCKSWQTRTSASRAENGGRAAPTRDSEGVVWVDTAVMPSRLEN